MAKSNKIRPSPKVKKPVTTTKAITIVEGGPRDEQSRVDGYGGHIGPLTTQYKHALSKFADDFYGSYNSMGNLFGFPKLDLASLKNMSPIKGISKVLDALNPNKLLNRFESLIGRPLQSIAGLYQDFKNDALGTLTKLTGNINIGGLNIGAMIRTGKMLYEDGVRVYNMVKSGDWSSLKGIADGLAKLGGTGIGQLLKPIIDLEATSALLSTFMTRAAELGDHVLVKKIMEMFGSKKHRNGALGAIVYNSAGRSDIYTLDAIVKVLGGAELYGSYPQVIRRLLENYRLEPFYLPEKLGEHKQRLVDLLYSIDKDWLYTEQGGERITKLEVFGYMSKDAILVMSDPSGIDFTTELMIAKKYPAEDIKTMQKRMYQHLVFNTVKDPRTGRRDKR